MNKVIVIGGFHHNTYGLIRSLGEAGIKSYVILEPCHPKVNWLFVSKYIIGNYILSEGENLVDYLLTTFSNEKVKPIIYSGSDASISLLDNAYDVLKDKFFIFNAKNTRGRINHYMNKVFMFPLAEKCGLTTIKTWHLKKSEIDSANLIYPILVKPNNSLGGTKADIKISYNKEQLLRNMHEGIDYILQEYIEKDYELMFMGLSIKTGKEVLFPGMIRKYRQYPYMVGGTSFACLNSLDMFPNFQIEKVLDFIDEIGYEGLFSIEFIVKGNKYYFLEINMRNDGNGYMSTGAGLNLPLIWYHYCCGITDNSKSLSLIKPFYFMSEETDYKHISGGHLTLANWLSCLHKTNSFFILNKRDIKPGLVYFALTFSRMIKRLIKK